MEYDDDEQFEPLFLSHKIEMILKDEIARDVGAEHYLQFQKQLEVDLVEMARQGSLEEAKSFIMTKLGKFNHPPATLTTPQKNTQATMEDAALTQEYAADV